MHHYRNTTATGTSLQRSRTHVTFSNVHLAMPGGHAPMSTGVPTDNGDYNPNSIGTRPAFGFYLHNVTGIHFMNSSFEFSKNDGRPAILANTGGNVSVSGMTVSSGSNSPFDIGFQGIAGYCTAGDKTTSGGTPRVSATAGSTSATGC